MLKLAVDQVRIKLISSSPEGRLVLWSIHGKQEAKRAERLGSVPQQMCVHMCELYYLGLNSTTCKGLTFGMTFELIILRQKATWSGMSETRF